jgi:hypothetical protein
VKLSLIFVLMAGCGSNYVACLDSGVAPDQSIADPGDLRKHEDLAKHVDLAPHKDLAIEHDMSECPLCDAYECAVDKNSCTTEAEKQKLESCHTADEDKQPSRTHLHCHTQTVLCHC